MVKESSITSLKNYHQKIKSSSQHILQTFSLLQLKKLVLLKSIKIFPHRLHVQKLKKLTLCKIVRIKMLFKLFVMKTLHQHFSQKVLLVEGDSDLIFLKGLSPLINNSYCFDKLNIPIIRINGKNNVKRFVNFIITLIFKSFLY